MRGTLDRLFTNTLTFPFVSGEPWWCCLHPARGGVLGSCVGKRCVLLSEIIPFPGCLKSCHPEHSNPGKRLLVLEQLDSGFNLVCALRRSSDLCLLTSPVPPLPHTLDLAARKVRLSGQRHLFPVPPNLEVPSLRWQIGGCSRNFRTFKGEKYVVKLNSQKNETWYSRIPSILGPGQFYARSWPLCPLWIGPTAVLAFKASFSLEMRPLRDTL